ncbi:SCG1 protein, partial [Crypturellus soui]|nr:SCG1 protein [Crypturellus soui]
KTHLSLICLCSGTMEGKWTSPSPHSEESSMLDLPSACDLAENFLPSNTTESSEEPYFFMDTLPSPPTGVSAVPADKDHIEEMVTQCIVEVLSNALSKPNAPPINPECKEILRKSGKNDRAKNEDKQLEMRHLKDSAENEEHGTGSVEKEQSQIEMETKMHMKGSDEKKLGWEEDKSEEEEDGHDISVHKAHENELQTTEMKHHETEEDENSYYREDKSRESGHHEEKAEQAIPNKQSASAEEFPGGNDQRSMGWARSDERTQHPDKRIHESEEGEAARSEKYHHESKERDSSHREREESSESEEAAEEKQDYKAERYYRKHRMGDSEEKSGEREKLAEESNAEEGDRRNHHRQHHREEAKWHREEKGGYGGMHGSEAVEEKRYTDQGGEQHKEVWQQSEESREEESKRHGQSEESHEKWQEERRHHDGSHEAGRHHPEGRTYGGGEEHLGRDHNRGSKEEKQQRVAERRRLQDSEEMEKLSVGERRGQVRRHYSTEDRDSAEEQRYPGNREEEDAEKDHSSDQIENEEKPGEGRYAEREQYKSHFPAESERSSVALYSPLHSLLRWKSHRTERRDGAGEQLLESREEARPTLSEKNLVPEYDYDWWEKKQILNALKHGRTEKRNLGKNNRFDVKRQYNRMDQLAQLLNYRKKSAEFPELYDSGEDLKKRHVIRNDRGNLSQRPLTEEEEKELENLAAMDLELQKIAEKFNDKRRG